MICPTCAEAADNSEPREEHCTAEPTSTHCDCQHRVPWRHELPPEKVAGHYILPAFA